MVNTELSRDIEISEDKIRYDAACRNILADKHVLAWILKATLKEYQDDSIENILKCIENPEVGSIKLEDTNAPERIVGISDSDKNLYEGNIFYDIRFLASTKDTFSDLIINLEEQNDFYPGYPILKRAAYYCSRMISAQNGTIFTGDDYGKLRKAVSIWICPNPPKKQENSITRYATKEDYIIGNAARPTTEYDLSSVILINLGNPSRNENDVLRLLSVLLSTEIKPQEKKQILEDNFKIPMTQKMSKEADTMCNLSDGIEQRGYNRGKSDGKLEIILELLRDNQPLEFISKITKFSIDKIVQIGEQNGVVVKQ